VQAELASLSSNSMLLIAEESGHNIQIDQPEAVIRAIRWVLDQVKSTTVEEAPPYVSV
jgi:pimeloyl-ACP methyl ester carboxylesterase